MPHYISPPPFIKAFLEVGDKSIVILLPLDITYQKLIDGIRSACRRCSIPSDQITSECSAIRLRGLGDLKAIVKNDEELLDALDQFQDALDTPQPPTSSADAGEEESDGPPPYDVGPPPFAVSREIPHPAPEVRRIAVEIPENFTVLASSEGLFKEGGIIDIELALW